jgi:beta-glucosidase
VLAETGKPLIVVIMAGRPLAIGDVLKNSDAVLYAFHGGTMAGPALADLIFGKESPSGKLPVTFVKGSGQIPFYYYRKNCGRPATPESWTPMDEIPLDNVQGSLGYLSYQLDYGYTPLLPFGFGLSYANFEYSDLKLSANTMTQNSRIEVKALITNTGDVAADEIVQFYIRDRVGSLTRPVKELKGFKKISLNAKESKEVVFELSVRDLEFFNGKETLAEPGEFDVWIGPNSDEGLHGEFILQ